MALAPGASATLPPCTIPSPPFLDESALEVDFSRVLLLGRAAPVGATPVASWAVTIAISFQPTKRGVGARVSGTFAVPAASISGLSWIHEAIAVPGASYTVTITNNDPLLTDSLEVSYGAMVQPTLTRVEV